MEKEEREREREDRKKAKDSEVMLWLDKVPCPHPRRQRLPSGLGF